MKSRIRIRLLVLLVAGCIGLKGYAQDPLQLNDSTVVHRDAIAATAPPVMDKKWNQVRTRWFSLNLGLAILLDHNRLSQDEDNIGQVGQVEPGTEFRGDRIMLSGQLLFFRRNPWRYMISANFNGLDAPQGKKKFDFIDWNVEIPLGAKAGWITVGKQKEGVGLEYVLPGTQAPFMERGTGSPMFVRQRNIGVRYSNNVLQQRMTYTFGYFNNYWETGKTFNGNGEQVVARVTGLPFYQSDQKLVHVGIGYRYNTATEGQLSFKAKPEANTAPSFINTGSFDADRAGTLMLEWIGVRGPLAVVSEYMSTRVNSPGKGDPRFSYFQLGGTWFITGEQRRYNKVTGNPGKLVPKRNFRFRDATGPGAFELGARYTHTDGTDGLIDGGVFNRFTTAFSWYPNAHFRYEINYGYGTLKKSGVTGHTGIWQFRAQFEL